jgi:uncharacterized protein
VSRPEPRTRPPPQPGTPAAVSVPVTAIPYYTWANHEDGAMRVWIPA